MKAIAARLAVAAVVVLAGTADAAKELASPIEKVLELLTTQEGKITEAGREADRLYEEASKWCVARSEELKFEIKTGKAAAEDLRATIDQETALIAELTTRVDQLSSDIATNEANLKSATEVHSKEAADFAAQEKELIQAIDTLQRATNILERELRKGASMMQLQSASSVASALGLLVEASALTSADAQQLAALVQTAQGLADGDGEAELNAPAAAGYQSKSTGIIDTLKDLQDKAEVQLEEARKKATKTNHDFAMLKDSLENQLRLANKEMAEAQKSIARSSEKKSTAEGDYTATTKELSEDEAALEDLHQDCLTKAQDYQAETKSRQDELKALGEAKKIIQETTSGAAGSTYDLAQVSLLQVSRSGSEAAGSQVVRLLRKLARKGRSPSLMMLASRVSSALGADAGNDPFAKVRGLISNMLDRLLSEADADASQKAYCDKELKEATAKHEDKKNTESKLSTSIEQMSARSAQLQAEVAELQRGLAALASSQAEMDKQRQQEKELFVKTKADLEQGLDGVKRALKVLRDFYGNADAAAGGAGSGIIGMLEVVESDFSKGLTETVAAEEKAQSSYVQETRENEVVKKSKEQDVAYKTKEATGLDKAIADATADRHAVSAELDAVEQYLAKLNDQCVGKPETFEVRAARRQAEVDGLKQALDMLSDGAVLLQQSRSSVRRTLRGTKPHVHA